MERNEAQDRHDEGRLGRVKGQAREIAERTRESMAAGASGLAEASREVAGRAGEKLDRAATVVREAEPDENLRRNVAGATESSVHRAGEGLHRAAPTIGRTAEKIADKAGSALHFAAGPLARILGTIAGTVGGWWRKASEERFTMPPEEEEACRAHFTSLMPVPGELPYERARTGYSLGYVAGRNPDYRGRSFEEIETDLRSGFGEEGVGAYDQLREFARFGYGRSGL